MPPIPSENRRSRTLSPGGVSGTQATDHRKLVPRPQGIQHARTPKFRGDRWKACCSRAQGGLLAKRGASKFARRGKSVWKGTTASEGGSRTKFGQGSTISNAKGGGRGGNRHSARPKLRLHPHQSRRVRANFATKPSQPLRTANVKPAAPPNNNWSRRLFVPGSKYPNKVNMCNSCFPFNAQSTRDADHNDQPPSVKSIPLLFDPILHSSYFFLRDRFPGPPNGPSVRSQPRRIESPKHAAVSRVPRKLSQWVGFPRRVTSRRQQFPSQPGMKSPRKHRSSDNEVIPAARSGFPFDARTTEFSFA